MSANQESLIKDLEKLQIELQSLEEGSDQAIAIEAKIFAIHAEIKQIELEERAKEVATASFKPTLPFDANTSQTANFSNKKEAKKADSDKKPSTNKKLTEEERSAVVSEEIRLDQLQEMIARIQAKESDNDILKFDNLMQANAELIGQKHGVSKHEAEILGQDKMLSNLARPDFIDDLQSAFGDDLGKMKIRPEFEDLRDYDLSGEAAKKEEQDQLKTVGEEVFAIVPQKKRDIELERDLFISDLAAKVKDEIGNTRLMVSKPQTKKSDQALDQENQNSNQNQKKETSERGDEDVKGRDHEEVNIALKVLGISGQIRDEFDSLNKEEKLAKIKSAFIKNFKAAENDETKAIFGAARDFLSGKRSDLDLSVKDFHLKLKPSDSCSPTNAQKVKQTQQKSASNQIG